MAEHAEHELIIIKRHEEEEHEAHSSAWKVAHADFMTAMMAFFLIMWLISVTDDTVRKGISEYFNPIHLSQGQTDLKGLNKPTTDPNKPGAKKGHADMPADVFNPMVLSEGLSDDKAVTEDAAAGAAAEAAPAAASGEAAAAAKARGPDAVAGPGAASVMPGTEAGEGAAFRNPYAILDEIAAHYRATHPVTSSTIVGDDRSLGVDGSEVDRDPFDPVYWQLGETPPARTDMPGRPGTAKALPEGVLPDAAAARPAPAPAGAAAAAPDAPPESAVPAVSAAVAAVDPLVAGPPAPVGAAPVPPPAADATLRTTAPPDGAAAPPVVVAPASPAPAKAPDAEVPAGTRVAAAAISAEVATVVEKSLDKAAMPDVTVTATGDGVAINLTDDADFAMFEVGSAVPSGKVVVLMEALGKALAGRKGDIVIRGYTDGRPFRSGVYDNWRLSAARAHMAYYMLTRGGLDEKRIVRIEGYADRDLKVKSDPFAPQNRRIEILLVGGAE